SNIDQIDSQGKTPLMWAAAKGDCEKVKKLLEYDASVTSRDYTGRCALSWATWNGLRGCATCVRVLLEKGANPNIKDTRNYESPLHWSLKGDKTTDIVTTLLDSGADIESLNASGYHPLHRAAFSGALQNTELLLDRGADIEAKTKSKEETPLVMAILRCKPRIIGLLLARGA
ncbi:ankyrin, partial [Lindgomyces ingoldianus]